MYMLVSLAMALTYTHSPTVQAVNMINQVALYLSALCSLPSFHEVETSLLYLLLCLCSCVYVCLCVYGCVFELSELKSIKEIIALKHFSSWEVFLSPGTLFTLFIQLEKRRKKKQETKSDFKYFTVKLVMFSWKWPLREPWHEKNISLT